MTLKLLAEAFSDMGVPVFLADIKGDLSGMCQPGCENKHIRRSIDTMGLGDFQYKSYPVTFWDVYGKKGLNVRTTISEMGPELLARLLDLNEIQTGILRIVFRIADDKGLLLIDLKDLRAMLGHVNENKAAAARIRQSRQTLYDFMDSLKLAAIVVHVADARTSALHPASATHRQLTDEQLIAAGVRPELVRFSVGIENPADIIADLEQALEQV